MRRLRQKVEVDPNKPAHVQTVRGVGYRLVAHHARAVIDRLGIRARLTAGARPGRPRPAARPGRHRRRSSSASSAGSPSTAARRTAPPVRARQHRRRWPSSPRSRWPTRSSPRCARSRRRSTACRPATCRPRCRSPATTSWPAWPRATTAWPPTSQRRNQELGRILAAIDEVSPRDGVEALVDRTAADATSAFALIDATVVLGDPAVGRGGGGRARRVPAAARRPARRRRGPRRAHRPPAGDPPLGARRPGPPRAVRQRDGRGHPQRPAVRHDREPEPAAPRARRGQGRLPARRQPQPADAADEHPGVRRAARRGARRIAGSGSSPSSPSGCRGWSASC